MKKTKTIFIAGCLALFFGSGLFAQTTLVSAGSSWKYLDNGSNQGTTWNGTSFNDAIWASGNAELGYGDGGEATVVSYGPSSSAKYTTTYFRKQITVADASIFTGYTLNVKRDDGIVVYINGVERYRNNMPTGTISYNTWASTACSDDGASFLAAVNLPVGSLVTGTNVIAVEIHQSGGTSSDISFDLSLIGTSTVDVTAPTVSTLSPADNATSVAATSNLVMTFNENVQKGAGTILIKVAGVTTQSINVTSASVTISGAVVTINPADFAASSAVNVEMPAGTFKDLANNNYAGITNATTWNFSVAGAGSATLSRGPYLQMGTSSSVIIRWRSNVATNSKVSFGLTAGSLTSNVTDPASLTDHIVQLTGLTPNTKYFYSIGSTTQVLQGDANNFFTTAPVIGSVQKTRVWVSGDCGNNSTNQVNVRTQYENYIGSNNTDVWLLLGDNAYNGGLDNEYQSNFYNIYKDKMLKQTVLWPAPGNHDYNSSSTRQNDHAIPYYDMFSLPTNAQVGGVASGTEAFYSYNYANIHFIALDSYGKESNSYRLYDTLGPQAVWVKQDLAANTQKWTVVYWHHPPYTMGSHNSDTESELISMRQNFIRILERYKVDLILCGHSHSYERSKLMKGHFGNESSFVAGTHHLSTSSAKYDGSANSCPYNKNASNLYNGTVYVVAGSAGQLGGTQTSFPHAAMYYSNASNGGSMALDIEDNRLSAKWVCADGVIRDQFTIVKDVNKTTNINITSGQSVVLTASWIGNYTWTPGNQSSRSVTVSPTSNTSYTVTDGVNCITDIFNVTVSANRIATDVKDNQSDALALHVFPNPSSNQTTIEFNTPFVGEVNLEIYTASGKLITTLVKNSLDNGHYNYVVDAEKENMAAGIYVVKLNFAEHQIIEKLVITK